MGKITAFCSKNTTEFSEISRWRWSECWGGDSPARHCRFVPATVKTVPANVGERHAAPGDALAVRTNRRQNGNSLRFVIARRPQADVAISGRQLRFRRKYPIIRPSTARFPRRFAPRNGNSDSLAPPNHHCNTRNCRRRSLSAATDAIGWYVLIGSLQTASAFPRLPRPLWGLAMTHQGSARCTSPPRNDTSGKREVHQPPRNDTSDKSAA